MNWVASGGLRFQQTRFVEPQDTRPLQTLPDAIAFTWRSFLASWRLGVQPGSNQVYGAGGGEAIVRLCAERAGGVVGVDAAFQVVSGGVA
jgi:hypothetical protein